jgi:hypothetical protein
MARWRQRMTRGCSRKAGWCSRTTGERFRAMRWCFRMTRWRQRMTRGCSRATGERQRGKEKRSRGAHKPDKFFGRRLMEIINL